MQNRKDFLNLLSLDKISSIFKLMLFLKYLNTNFLLLIILSQSISIFSHASTYQNIPKFSPCNDSINIVIDTIQKICRGGDGKIQIIASGGNGNFAYSLNGGLNFSSTTFKDTILIDSLQSSTYNISLIDDSACVKNYGIISLGKIQENFVDSILINNQSCCENDGSIQIINNLNYNLNYSLNNNNFSQQNSFYNLSKGNYNINIMDNNNCEDSVAIDIILKKENNINFNIQVSNVICKGDSNGTLTLINPDTCFSYKLWRFSSDTSLIISNNEYYYNNLKVGNYAMVAKSNFDNCVDTSIIYVINEPNQLSVSSAVSLNSNCSSTQNCDGKIISGQVFGGISPYHYFIKNVYSNVPLGPLSTDSSFTYVCSGTYYIKYLDANACELNDTIVVIDNSLKFDSLIINDVKCFGDSNGEIKIYQSGGLYPVQLFCNNILSSNIINNLASAKYIISAIDSNGCKIDDSVHVKSPDSLLFKIRDGGVKSETCLNSSKDGELVLDIFGGTPPYMHDWYGVSGNSGTGIGDTISFLSSDTIVYTVRDYNGCNGSTKKLTSNVTFIDALNSNYILLIDSIVSNSDSICYASFDGFINIFANGKEPIKYSIDSGFSFQNSSIFNFLSADNYDIVLEDSIGCKSYLTYEIFEKNEIIIQLDSLKNISCFDGNDGYISLKTKSNTHNFNFLWSFNQDTNSYISNLKKNTYVVKVTDISNCSVVDSFSLIELGNPIISSEVSNTDVNCHGGNDGISKLSITGGHPSYDSVYFCVWKNSIGDTIANGCEQDSLRAGKYFVHINDSLNCGPIIDTIIIKEPDSLFFSSIRVVDNLCHGASDGELIFEAIGGNTPYRQFNLKTQQINMSTQNNYFDNLVSHKYNFWIIDNNDCSSDTNFIVKVGEPGKLVSKLNVSSPSCNGFQNGSIVIKLNSATSPYTAKLINNGQVLDSFLLYQNNEKIVNEMFSGNYNLQFVDYNGCESDTLFFINEPEIVESNFNTNSFYYKAPTLINFENLSQNANKFIWDFGNGNILQTASLEDQNNYYEKNGKYNIKLIASNDTLSNLCNDTAEFEIEIEGYEIFNVFTPNNDAINDEFSFNETLFSQIDVEIFNKWGQKVFGWDDLNYKWDGTGFSGERLPESVYYFVLNATGFSGQKYQKKGHISLLR